MEEGSFEGPAGSRKCMLLPFVENAALQEDWKDSEWKSGGEGKALFGWAMCSRTKVVKCKYQNPPEGLLKQIVGHHAQSSMQEAWGVPEHL